VLKERVVLVGMEIISTPINKKHPVRRMSQKLTQHKTPHQKNTLAGHHTICCEIWCTFIWLFCDKTDVGFIQRKRYKYKNTGRGLWLRL